MFEVWDETYEKRFVGDVIFSEDSKAYDIGIKPLRKRDLKDFTENDNIVNKFEEILRHNNVSDKENAFNRLIALFIAKLADEIEKDDNDVVDFQYKVGTDTFETLQDRLQRLHKDGMEKFMNEEILYIDDNYAEDLVKQYTGQKRVNMINSLKDTIRKLKFYTNNDFAFKDVHNEELFLQNGKVLLEVVELFENYRIINVSQANAQFLGDMFEQLLNQGFKQNEGQFFTPNQITRFIWESLPLKRIMFSGERIHYPKVIDYACGAGHFIVQGVLCIKDFLTREDVQYKELHPDKYFYGIEKDYRLARVSRVSLYMNGCNEGNIIFGDGLDNYKDKGIDNKKFDILVANPPYSVKEFKSHLKLYNNRLELLDGNYITNQGSEIETCFVERISQLLKPNGIAAVILPSSLLNKDGQSFNKARESIFYNFKIKAIVEMGSKTFGATGTNTVIVFLEKYSEPPKRINLIKDSIEQIFDGNINAEFEDVNIFEEYINIINVDKMIYKKFINRKLISGEIAEEKLTSTYFSGIYIDFVNTSEYKSKIQSKQFISLDDKEKNRIILDMFYKYAFNVEKVKMTYLALTYNCETLIISGPTENDTQEKFLGYKWSNRKGQEGIQIIKYGGELYWDREKNPNDYDKTFASDLIKSMFDEIENRQDDNAFYLESELLKDKYHRMKTSEMLDFTKSNFLNNITTIADIKRDYDFDVFEYKLNDKSLFSLQIGDRVVQDEIVDNGKIPVYSANVNEPFGRINKYNIKDFSRPSVLWGIDGDFITNYIDKGIEFYPTDHCGVLRVLTNNILPKYMMYALYREGEHKKFSRQNRASIDRVKALSVYVPNLGKQKEIVSAFDEIDKHIKILQMRNNKIINELDVKYNTIFLNNNFKVSLDNYCEFLTGYAFNSSDFTNQGIPILRIKNIKNGKVYIDNNSMYNDSIMYLKKYLVKKGDILMAMTGATVGKVGIYELDGDALLNQRVLCIRPKSNNLFVYYLISNISFYNQVQILATGNAQQNISDKQIKSIMVQQATIDEQREFNRFAQIKADEQKKLQYEKEELLRQKEELIKKYFR